MGGAFSIWHWIILILVVAVLFGGRGRISSMMGDLAHGIRNFREGLKDPNATADSSEDKPRISEGKGETVEGKKSENKSG